MRSLQFTLIALLALVTIDQGYSQKYQTSGHWYYWQSTDEVTGFLKTARTEVILSTGGEKRRAALTVEMGMIQRLRVILVDTTKHLPLEAKGSVTFDAEPKGTRILPEIQRRNRGGVTYYRINLGIGSYTMVNRMKTAETLTILLQGDGLEREYVVSLLGSSKPLGFVLNEE